MSTPPETSPSADTLKRHVKFTFSPHILEDLGVNLYTSLSKALVEFVANAHDADASNANVSFDLTKINNAKIDVKAQYDKEVAAAKAVAASKEAGKKAVLELKPLGERALSEDAYITIEDDGCGMSQNDLEQKFLVIGRRRRLGEEQTARTPNARIIMGRKGLGKLAGFGIARLIEITSKVDGETHATKIILNLEDLLAGVATQPPTPNVETGEKSSLPAHQKDIQVPIETIPDGGRFPKNKGTRIVLKSLVYDGLREELENELPIDMGESFYGIKPEDFSIKVNGVVVQTTASAFAQVWPEDASVSDSELVPASLPALDGTPECKFQYRIRFRGKEDQAKKAKNRGFRIYAHNRLASHAGLVDLGTSIHGLQYTSYMDGVVIADFIDEQKTDYISTNRQTLRWETPLLARLKEFLTKQLEKAVGARADRVAGEIDAKLKSDLFTKETIEGSNLPAHRQNTAWKIAKMLAKKDLGQIDSEFYKTTMRSIVSGLGHGNIISTIYDIAKQEKPELQSLIAEITNLTRQEMGDFLAVIDGRLKAISALSKIYKEVDRNDPKKEKELHELFRKNPWLIDPTYFEFLTSDEDENVVEFRLRKELGIDDQVAAGAKSLQTEERPDLTFLLGSYSLKRFVIVEFKAPNIALSNEHLTQLQGYMIRAKTWLDKTHKDANFKVEGVLIGTKDWLDRKSDNFLVLEERIRTEGPQSAWQVWDIGEVLKRAEAAHKELLDVYKKASKAPVSA